jgi:catechol 2,3-dioxygenase-like lactoylglutathione lyase family enzyme
MGIHLGRVGHIGIHVSDVDRSIDFYRGVLGLKLTGRWGPPDIGRPICFMRIDDKQRIGASRGRPRGAREARPAVL